MPKVAFITGASSGLGHGMARHLARHGFAVAAAARRLEALEDLCGEIRAEGGVALPLELNVADQDAVHRAVARCAESLGAPDLLVANAGISEQTGGRDLSAAAVERVLRVNFLGSVYAVEAVLPAMLERGSGHLVAVGSLAGYGGLPLSAAYSASKGAVYNFFESMRLDLRGTGVDVTVITPGFVRTPMTDRNAHPMPFLLETEDAVDRMVRAILRRDRLLTFPLPLALATWFAQVLPPAAYDALLSRLRREKHPAPGEADPRD